MVELVCPDQEPCDREACDCDAAKEYSSTKTAGDQARLATDGGNGGNVLGSLRVKTRKPPNAPDDVAHLSCGVIHLAEIAYRLGRVLEFDPETETFPHDSEANAMLTKSYRTPWTLPEKI